MYFNKYFHIFTNTDFHKNWASNSQLQLHGMGLAWWALVLGRAELGFWPHQPGQIRYISTSLRFPNYKMGMHACFNHFQFCGTLWTVAHQVPQSMAFSGKSTGVSCHALPQGIFPTQGLKLCLLHLLHCRHILYCWVTREAHKICIMRVYSSQDGCTGRR